jgi:hypothetical protein
LGVRLLDASRTSRARGAPTVTTESVESQFRLMRLFVGDALPSRANSPRVRTPSVVPSLA